MDIILFKQAGEVNDGITGGTDSLTVVYRCVFDEALDSPEEARSKIVDYISAQDATIGDLHLVPVVLDSDMYIQDPEIEQTAPTYFNVTVSYERAGPSSIIAGSAPELTFAFSNRLQSLTIRNALFQERMPPHPGTDPIGTLLNVTEKGEVEGASAMVNVSVITITMSGKADYFDAVWHERAENLVGHCNDAARTYLGRTYQKGELRVLGFTGSISSTGTSEFQFEIGYKKNTPRGNELPDPPGYNKISGIDLERDLFGWERVWLQWKKTKDDQVKKLRPTAEALYVYRDTWEFKSFSNVGL